MTDDGQRGASGGQLKGRKILIVDDEEDVRTYLGALLEDAGAETVEASNGDEGLSRAKQDWPDLITLDLSMPGTDGVMAFQRLRQDDDTENIPVCVVTGHPEFRKLIYERPERPPEGYLSKPIDEDQLVKTLRRILELRDRRARAEAERS